MNLTEKLAWPTPTMTTLSGMLDAATKESIVWTTRSSARPSKKPTSQPQTVSQGLGHIDNNRGLRQER